jgi:hypothetical protein
MSRKSPSAPPGIHMIMRRSGSSARLAKACGVPRAPHARPPAAISCSWSPTCTVITPSSTKNISSSRVCTWRFGPAVSGGSWTSASVARPPVWPLANRTNGRSSGGASACFSPGARMNGTLTAPPAVRAAAGQVRASTPIPWLSGRAHYATAVPASRTCRARTGQGGQRRGRPAGNRGRRWVPG